jgi:hypothetical protein
MFMRALTALGNRFQASILVLTWAAGVTITIGNITDQWPKLAQVT